MKQKITRPVSIRIKYTRYVIPILLITFLSIGAIDTIFYFHSVKESSEHEQTAYSNTALTSLESYFSQFTSDSSIFFYKNATQNNLINITQDEGLEFQQLLLNDAPYYPSLSMNYSDNVFFIGASTLARNKNYYKPQKCGLFYVKFYLFLCCTELYFIFICDIMRYETQL